MSDSGPAPAEDHADREADRDGLALVERALTEHELFAWLDLRVDSVEPGRVVFEIPFQEKFANLTAGTVHGGIIATLVDTSAGFALRSTFEDPTAAGLTTTDLDVRYVRPATDDVRVATEVVRAGQSLGVTRSEVTTDADDESKVVATGGATYRLFRE